MPEDQGRSRNPIASVHGFLKAVKPNKWQFFLNVFLTILIGALLSITKFAQGVMTGRDADGDGAADNGGEFVVDSALVSTSFLITFGLAKAVSNLFVGILADRFGRKVVMVAGWVLGVPVPVMILAARSWTTVLWANVFLGLQQGICWTLTIVLMVDYAGPEHRGLAVGINETAGYSAVAVFNVVAAALIGERDFRGKPFWVVLGLMCCGLVMSFFILRDSKNLVRAEEQARRCDERSGDTSETGREIKEEETERPRTGRGRIAWPSGRTSEHSVGSLAFVYASFLNRSLVLCCLAGSMINFCTAFAWGILTKWAADYGGKGWGPLPKTLVAQILLAYSLPKGVLQFATGFLSDRVGRRWPVSVGLLMCACAFVYLAVVGVTGTSDAVVFGNFAGGAAILGVGTAVMYPNLIGAVAEHADPTWRASCVGTYRFWRDLGYAVGGFVLGAAADRSSASVSAGVGAVLTFVVSLLFGVWYRDRVEGALDMQHLELGIKEGGEC